MNAYVLAAPWFAFVLLVPLLLRWRPRLSEYAPASAELPLVSIIVPARNEALNIGPCLASLLSTDYPHKEIIVVDDGSTDATADIARALADGADEIRITESKPLPPGWIGKSWACWNGYEMARGELLLFTDADTRHDEDLLRLAVRAQQQSGADLLSLLPRQIMDSSWERIILPHIFLGISLRYISTERINRTRNPRQVIANGQFILMPRTSYQDIDGHQGVRASVVEDLALAQRTVASGKKLLLLHAPEHMETRMYRSLSEIIEGWSKNLAIGAQLVFPRAGRLLLWCAVLLGLLLWVVPPVLLVAGLFSSQLASLRQWSVLACVSAWLGWLMVHIRMHAGISTALLFPVGGLMTSFLLARSAWRGSRVEWRGRTYNARPI